MLNRTNTTSPGHGSGANGADYSHECRAARVFNSNLIPSFSLFFHLLLLLQKRARLQALLGPYF